METWKFTNTTTIHVADNTNANIYNQYIKNTCIPKDNDMIKNDYERLHTQNYNIERTIKMRWSQQSLCTSKNGSVLHHVDQNSWEVVSSPSRSSFKKRLQKCFKD